ncbi:MAG TPA: class I SAM-dependent rRNA methyltransferase [Bryobacteraceae bacterium]|nr:class I SAM-dependent rRNA methyltransferase [Bryobacteraceae bacterium]
MHTVRINRKGANRIASGHPWIFTSDLLDRGEAVAGEAVVVVDPSGAGVGTAHYSDASQISLRMLSGRPETIDRAFFLRRIAEAEAYRKRVVSNTEAYRLVHGEGDQLPGLVIDRYGEYFTIQTLDQGMDGAKAEVVSVLEELFSPLGIVERNDVAVRKREALPLQTGVLAGSVPDMVPIQMNDLALHADLLHGQKTGIFLDQRENYVAAARYARGRALDCFASTGGFALHLAPKCESVEAVDSSEAALRAARLNCEANTISNVEFREADVFELLAGYASAHRRFDIVVLDPPAFAKSRQNLEAAVRGYREINRRALELLNSGGILVTCSCSHHLSEAALLEIVASASLDTGRKLRVIERRMQAQDHPVLLTVPETLYLKCMILQVI